MRSSNARQGGYLANGPVFSLLAIYMPMAVLAVLIFLSKALLPLQTIILFISGGLSALAASLYCDFMKDTKSSRTSANIRGSIIILAISYILASLFRWGIPWEKRLLPDFTNVLASLGALYVWVSVISLKNFFSIRKQFESYTELYRGEELYKALFEDRDLLQNLDNEISRIEKNYFIQFIIIGILLFFNLNNKTYFPFVLYLFLFIFLASGICIFGFLEIIRREHYCAAEGLSLSVVDRSRHTLGTALFSMLPIAAAILLSSDKSLIPFSLIVGFFGWLLGLFRRTTSLVMGSSPEAFDPMPYFEPPVLPFDQMEKSDPWPIWAWLKYGFIVFAAAVFLCFMVSPLFDQDKTKLSFRRKLGRIIAEWLRGVLAAMSSFFAAITGGTRAQKLRRPSAEEIQRTAGAVFGAYSPARRRALKQSVTLFARLIIWGGEVRQAAWKPVYAPGEYCGILAASAPASAPEDAPAENDLNGKIIRCGELFEKALYSADILSDAERKEFKELVEEITFLT